MERVTKGEPYWYIDTSCGNINVSHKNDNYILCSDENNFKCRNYFYTKEEAERMAKKLRAVLAGADVIEMPSEEELEMIAELEYPTGTDDYLRAKGIKLAQAAFNGGVNWLKSKIVK